MVDGTEAATEAVKEIVADVHEGAAIQIENAEARIERAEEVAQEITDAALRAEIVRQVQTFHGEIETWRTATETALSGILERLSNFDQAIASLQAAQAPAVVIAEPAKSPEPSTPQAPSALNPSDAVDALAEAAGNPPSPAPKRRAFNLL